METTNKFILDALQHAPQLTSAWMEVRLGRFTGSQLSALFTEPRTKAEKEAGELSQTARKYIMGKVMELATGLPADEIGGRAIDWGNDHEEDAITEVARVFASPMERVVFKPPFKLFNQYSGCSPDAFIWDTPNELELGVEVKCPYNSTNHFLHAQVNNGEELKEVNADYYWQIQMNMLTFNKPQWVFASYDPRQPERRRLHVARIYANPDDCALMCQKMEAAEVLKQQWLAQWLNVI